MVLFEKSGGVGMAEKNTKHFMAEAANFYIIRETKREVRRLEDIKQNNPKRLMEMMVRDFFDMYLRGRGFKIVNVLSRKSNENVIHIDCCETNGTIFTLTLTDFSAMLENSFEGPIDLSRQWQMFLYKRLPDEFKEDYEHLSNDKELGD